MTMQRWSSRRLGSRLASLVLGAALVVVGCSSGDSILDAGLETTVAPTAAPGETLPPTIPATTTTTPLATLPPCPVDELGDGPVEITFWHGLGGESEEALKDLVAGYHASQDRVRVTLQNQGGYNETIDKYLQSGTGSRPEMVLMPEYMLQQMVDSDSVIPVAACVEESDFDMSAFLPRIRNAYVTGGVLWGMPFNVSNPVLYFNRKMFREAGLDPDKPPTTLNELRRYSQRLVDSGASGTGIALDTGQDNGGGWFLEQWFAKGKQLYADNGNGRLAPATQVLYNSEFGVDVLTQVQQMVSDGLAVNVGANPSGYDSFLKLADRSQPAAMTIGTSAALGTLKVTLDGGLVPGMTSDDFGVGPMPGPATQPGVLVGGASMYVMSDKGDEEAAAAWDFVSYAVSAEVQSEWASRTGYVPVRTDAPELDPLRSTYRDDPRFKVGYDQLNAASDDPSSAGPVIGPLREIRGVNADAVGAILNGADVRAELAGAAEQANSLIRNYNARN